MCRDEGFLFMKNQKVVIKLGSSLIITSNQINCELLKKLARQIKILKQNGFSILLVCSGAVALGKILVGQNNENTKIEKQALAAIGQAYLIKHLINFFSNQGLTISQLLFNKSDLKTKQQQILIKKVLNHLLNKDIIPLINENDAINLNCFQGNDYLASEITKIVSSQKLILLTNVDGLIGKKKVIKQVNKVDNNIQSLITKQISNNGFGGMKDKLIIAKDLINRNKEVIVASGFQDNNLLKILINQEQIGTRFKKEFLC